LPASDRRVRHRDPRPAPAADPPDQRGPARAARRRVTRRGGAVFGLASLVIGCAPVVQEPVTTTAAAAQGDDRGMQRGEPAGVVTADRPAAPAERRRQPARPETGWRQLGDASYYGPQFAGRTMANGRRFDPGSTSVAHRTLPFGTTVLVQNLANGRAVTATVEDRGPFVRGRIIDLSPRLAERLGMLVQGVVPVEVTPIKLTEAVD
jgi:rare lipoprotein A